MKRNFPRLIGFSLVVALVVAIVGALLVPDAFAKRSRGRRSSSAHGRRAERGRASHGRKARGREARRGRSRASRRELARGGRYVRERVVVRGRHGRRVVRYRLVRRAESESAPVASTPRVSGGGIPSDRITEIQTALIKAGYLDGPPSGQYDEATIQAMKQFQGASGFPQTGMPSAPALKKLGVSKRSNDGFAVPVNNVSEAAHKQRPPQAP